MTSGKVSPATDDGLTARRFDDLAEALSGVRTANQMKSVNEGVSYQEISRQTGASTATVTRVAHWLRYGEGGYLAILKKVRK